MADLDNPHFKPLFWFCVFVEFLGIAFLAGLVWLPVPEKNHDIALTAVGFIIATLLTVPLGYLLGGNPSKKSSAIAIPENTETTSTTTTTSVSKPPDTPITPDVQVNNMEVTAEEVNIQKPDEEKEKE